MHFCENEELHELIVVDVVLHLCGLKIRADLIKWFLHCRKIMKISEIVLFVENVNACVFKTRTKKQCTMR